MLDRLWCLTGQCELHTAPKGSKTMHTKIVEQVVSAPVLSLPICIAALCAASHVASAQFGGVSVGGNMHAEASVTDGQTIAMSDSKVIDGFDDLPANVAATTGPNLWYARADCGASGEITPLAVSAGLGMQTFASWGGPGYAEATVASNLSMYFTIAEPTHCLLSWHLLVFQGQGSGFTALTLSGPDGSIVAASTPDQNGSQQGALTQMILGAGLYNLKLEVQGDVFADAALNSSLAIGYAEFDLMVIPAPTTCPPLALALALGRRRR